MTIERTPQQRIASIDEVRNHLKGAPGLVPNGRAIGFLDYAKAAIQAGIDLEQKAPVASTETTR